MWLVRTGNPAPCGAHRAILLQVGFTRVHVTVELRELLPHDFTLASSPASCVADVGAVCFCGTFLRLAPTGRYPAPCPVKPGLSSPIPRCGTSAIARRTSLGHCSTARKRRRIASGSHSSMTECGGKETRTPDPHAASVMLYQLSYAPKADVETRGLEPLTSCLQSRRSTS